MFKKVLQPQGKCSFRYQYEIFIIFNDSSQHANIAYFLITIDGTTYDQTTVNNLSTNSVLRSTIEKETKKLLCSNRTEILLLENSIRDFSAPCSHPQLLERQLNNALHQAGIYTMNFVIFSVEEVVDDHG